MLLRLRPEQAVLEFVGEVLAIEDPQVDFVLAALEGGRGQRQKNGHTRCAAVSRPQHGPDRRSPRIAEETCGRRFRRGRETCAERGSPR